MGLIGVLNAVAKRTSCLQLCPSLILIASGSIAILHQDLQQQHHANSPTSAILDVLLVPIPDATDLWIQPLDHFPATTF